MKADVTVTIPTLAWVLPLVALIGWLWYRMSMRLWDHIETWLVRRMETKIAALTETKPVCPLPKPRATDMPDHFLVHEPNDHIYSIPVGTLGQDENMKAWRLTKDGWVPWD